MNKLMTIATMTVAIVAFQNFDYASFYLLPVEKVDHQIRKEHAKELLGKQYRGSFAQKAEGLTSLNMEVYRTLNKYLPKAYKWQAGAVAQAIITEAQANNLDPVFVMAVIKTESSFNPKARGRHGEIGLMQIKPDTAEWMAKKNKMKWKGAKSLENPVENVKLGIAFMSHLRDSFDNKAAKYVNAYNIGATKLRRMYASDVKPKEYSSRVLNNYATIYKGIVATRLPMIAASSL